MKQTKSTGSLKFLVSLIASVWLLISPTAKAKSLYDTVNDHSGSLSSPYVMAPNQLGYGYGSKPQHDERENMAEY